MLKITRVILFSGLFTSAMFASSVPKSESPNISPKLSAVLQVLLEKYNIQMCFRQHVDGSAEIWDISSTQQLATIDKHGNVTYHEIAENPGFPWGEFVSVGNQDVTPAQIERLKRMSDEYMQQLHPTPSAQEQLRLFYTWT